jgi:hypothetical protein
MALKDYRGEIAMTADDKRKKEILFEQPYIPAANSSTEQRTAKAAEYASSQLYYIRRALEQIAAGITTNGTPNDV